MSVSVRYPIGEFTYPDRVMNTELSRWIADIELLPSRLTTLVELLPAEQLDLSYRDNGWSVRQLVHHLADSHTNGYIRFHWAMTEVEPVIKPYNQDQWANLEYLREITLMVSINVLSAIHIRWVSMMKKLASSDLERTYIHPDDQRIISLQQAIALYAWHGNHHLGHIEKVREKYRL
jgi:uncharacterized damage-inducible protein DinB